MCMDVCVMYVCKTKRGRDILARLLEIPILATCDRRVKWHLAVELSGVHFAFMTFMTCQDAKPTREEGKEKGTLLPPRGWFASSSI